VTNLLVEEEWADCLQPTCWWLVGGRVTEGWLSNLFLASPHWRPSPLIREDEVE
jgi:hypothetical protein